MTEIPTAPEQGQAVKVEGAIRLPRDHHNLTSSVLYDRLRPALELQDGQTVEISAQQIADLYQQGNDVTRAEVVKTFLDIVSQGVMNLKDVLMMADAGMDDVVAEAKVGYPNVKTVVDVMNQLGVTPDVVAGMPGMKPYAETLPKLQRLLPPLESLQPAQQQRARELFPEVYPPDNTESPKPQNMA